jgi:hypothetical protein
MQKSPLSIVKERFTDKAGLVKALESLTGDGLWIDRVNGDKGLPRVSNKKLLHLHEVLSQVKKDFGSRDKLIDAIVKGRKRDKDADYRANLTNKSTPALFGIVRADQKRARAAS